MMFRNMCSRVIQFPIVSVDCRFANSAMKIRNVYCGACLRNPKHISKPDKPSPAMASKYRVITETNARVIENTVDQMDIDSEDNYPIYSDEFDGINLQRGQTGVFEIQDLVDLLKRENGRDMFVTTVPAEINYVEYICIVSARSKRHILALAEFVRKVYKKKCNSSDLIPRIEGKDSDEWMALDLGNIALHIFSDKARATYDLESLWSVGPEFDEQVNKKNNVVNIFENYSAYLKDLKPLS